MKALQELVPNGNKVFDLFHFQFILKKLYFSLNCVIHIICIDNLIYNITSYFFVLGLKLNYVKNSEFIVKMNFHSYVQVTSVINYQELELF